jgi:hypothetical protein
MKVDLLQLAIIQKAPESSHHPTVEITVVLVLIPVDQVKVPAEGPRTRVTPADIAELLQEGDLVCLSLWAINTSQPAPPPTGETLAVTLLAP